MMDDGSIKHCVPPPAHLSLQSPDPAAALRGAHSERRAALPTDLGATHVVRDEGGKVLAISFSHVTAYTALPNSPVRPP
jgi:hypothetical protein